METPVGLDRPEERRGLREDVINFESKVNTYPNQSQYIVGLQGSKRRPLDYLEASSPAIHPVSSQNGRTPRPTATPEKLQANVKELFTKVDEIGRTQSQIVDILKSIQTSLDARQSLWQATTGETNRPSRKLRIHTSQAPREPKMTELRTINRLKGLQRKGKKARWQSITTITLDDTDDEVCDGATSTKKTDADKEEGGEDEKEDLYNATPRRAEKV
ncbi:hypothetical protein IFR05_003172 [Cadophora sp. M221]|nr:hypothetical protein IFR05_003172 [Cadophora sp. M221]